MKLQFLVLSLYCFTIIQAHLRIRGVAKKRDAAYRKKDINGSKCVLNETITNDYEILSSVVSESKYIFTARVLSVKKIKRGTKPNAKIFMFYKLYIRLVMKGDIDELKSHVFSGDGRTLNGAIAYAAWLRTNKCAYKLYRHSSGVFLSDGFYEGSSVGSKPRLRLLNEPLPLSLYDLDRVNAALKGSLMASAWEVVRRTLVSRIGANLSLPSVIRAMLAGDSNWKAVALFCEAVMLQKEAAERDHERTDPARRRRRDGRGRNRPVSTT